MKSAFNIKMSKYDERCTAEGITFIPLAVDSFGGWHGAALDVFSKLARQLSRQVGKEEEEVTRQLSQLSQGQRCDDGKSDPCSATSHSRS